MRSSSCLFAVITAISAIGCFENDVRAEAESATALVTVNGGTISQSDLDLEFLSRQIPADLQPAYRDRLLIELVERRLIAGFLSKRKIEVPERDLENQFETLRRIVASTDGDFDAAISGLGFTKESLREHLALPLKWQVYVQKTVTDQQLRDDFRQHRAQFDGTQVRASQIVTALTGDAPEEEWTAAEQNLMSVRASIDAGETEFADAARKHSTSPSGKEGGDLGFFEYRGRLPSQVASQAFALEVGGLSPVFRSPFGVHLLTVTDRKAGDLSLEDVREKVLRQRSRRMWADQVQVERRKARIEWHIDPPPQTGQDE